MQDAYVVEKGDRIGKWSEIGYTGPGSTFSGGSESAIFAYLEGLDSDEQWTVTTKQKLNDCPKDQEKAWKLGAAIDAAASANGQGSVLYRAGGESVCYDLTPSFKSLTSGRFY